MPGARCSAISTTFATQPINGSLSALEDKLCVCGDAVVVDEALRQVEQLVRQSWGRVEPASEEAVIHAAA